jgi:uncharacterized membrane protein HdeD (DUF308 family)
MSSSTSSAAPDAVPRRTPTAAFTSRGIASTEVHRVWWLYLVTGIAWVFYGLFVLSLRPGSVASLAWFAGFAFIFGGFSQFIIAQRVDSWRWLFYVGGVIAILAGILAFAWPGKTLVVLAVFIAWYLVIGGIFSVISAFVGPKRDWWWMGIIVGLLQFVLGVWAIGSPGRELLLMVNLIGIYMIFFGVSEIFAAFSVRSGRDARPA